MDQVKLRIDKWPSQCHRHGFDYKELIDNEKVKTTTTKQVPSTPRHSKNTSIRFQLFRPYVSDQFQPHPLFQLEHQTRSMRIRWTSVWLKIQHALSCNRSSMYMNSWQQVKLHRYSKAKSLHYPSVFNSRPFTALITGTTRSDDSTSSKR